MRVISFLITLGSFLFCNINLANAQQSDLTGVQQPQAFEPKFPQASFFVMTQDGGWFLDLGAAQPLWVGLSADFAYALRNSGQIVAAAGAPNGDWILVNSMGIVASSLNNTPEGALLHSKVAQYGASTTSIVFDSDGQGFAVVGNGEIFTRYMPNSFYSAVLDARRAQRRILHAAVDNGRWALVCDGWSATSGASALLDALNLSTAAGKEVGQVFLSGTDGWAFSEQPRAQGTSILDRLERRPFSIGAVNYQNLMDMFVGQQVVAFSIATINTQTGAREQRGYGVKESGTERFVGVDTKFEVQSISKTVGALTTLASLTKQTSNFGLTSTISNFPSSTISSWRNSLSVDYSSSATVWDILTHTSGLEPGGAPVYTSQESLVDLLRGTSQSCPSCPGAFGPLVLSRAKSITTAAVVCWWLRRSLSR
ncbi:MAG: hypothetical protein R3E66_00085 [bacterium]